MLGRSAVRPPPPMTDAPPRFADALLASIEAAFGERVPPPVAALHRPARLARGRVDAEFCAIELADGAIGLGYALLDGTADALAGVRADALARAGTPALDLARAFLGTDPLSRTLGLAAINALSQSAMRAAGVVPPPAADSLGGLDPRAGERIGMVGWFPPLTRRVVDTGASLVVLELDPALAGRKDGFEVTLDPTALAGCDKVLATTTLLLNDTLDAVLRACAGAARVVLVGPTGGFLPDAAFARGVHALGGTRVVDRDGFVAALAAGGPWSAHATKYLIDARAWRGLPPQPRCGARAA